MWAHACSVRVKFKKINNNNNFSPSLASVAVARFINYNF